MDARRADDRETLRILFVEDSEADADLALLALGRGGFKTYTLRVETRADMAEALKADAWDLIICDNHLPRFSAAAALALWHEMASKSPLIVVTGTIGEEAAVELIKGGAADVILKSNLGRLAPKVERILAERHAHEARQAAERAHRQAQARYQQIVDTAHDGIMTLDADGKVTFCNRRLAEITGYDVEEIVGNSGLALLGEESAAKATAMMERRRRGYADQYDLQFTRKDGKPMWVLTSSSPLQDDAGRYGGALVMFADITDRKRAEEELRQAQKMEAIGQLTGGIAHDFNNLLTVVIGNLDVLDRRIQDEALRKRLAAARRGARRGASLTQSLLAYSRRQTLQPRIVSLNEIIGQTTTMLARTLGEHIEIESALAADTPATRIDPNLFESALVNLAVNARDAMENGGKLTVETGRAVLDEAYAARHEEVSPGEYALVAVSDTGSGIPPDLLGRIFEPFFTSKATGKGTGLGLSMVYGFVKQSRGHIKAYSEVGHGTTMKLYFPRCDEERQIVEAGDRMDEDLSGTETVLVVEDDSDVRETTVMQLEDHGYHVLQAPNGPAALRLLEEITGVALVVSDMVMPGNMSGADLAAIIAARFAHVKVLLVSGYAERALERNGGLTPELRFLAKPFDKQGLLRAVRSSLDE